MRKKTKSELERAALIKTTRALTRLEFSLAADERLNEILPAVLSDFDSGVAAGELKKSIRASLAKTIGA